MIGANVSLIGPDDPKGCVVWPVLPQRRSPRICDFRPTLAVSPVTDKHKVRSCGILARAALERGASTRFHEADQRIRNPTYRLADREQVLAEVVAFVLGAHRFQHLVVHLAPALDHVKRFVERRTLTAASSS
jgi:hypothetical protein